MTTSALQLRPVVAGDRDFLVDLYAATRKEELDQVPWTTAERAAFVRMQFDAQDHEYRRLNLRGSFDVIVLEDRPVGRLYVDRRPADIRIVDISLAPEARGRGIGSTLIRALQREAATTGRIVSIHVELHNRAAALYQRLGFVAVAERGIYRRMEWEPRP